MKTIALDDDLYLALQEHAEDTGRPIDELATDAIKIWLLGLEISKTELAKIETTERDRQKKGDSQSNKPLGAPYSFYDIALNMNLDGPPDWSARLDDYLYGEPCDAKD